MEENQNGLNGQEAPRTYGEESANQSNYGNQPNYGGQPNYGNQPNYGGQPNYGNQPNYGGQPNYGEQRYPYAYGAGGQMMPANVNNIFCYILLAVMPLHKIVIILSNYFSFKSLDLNSVMAGDVSSAVNPAVSVLSVFNYVFWILYIVFLILDIVQINKAQYKITGLVLFGIFLKQGYYVWRAHVLREKMTFPIVYTVCFVLLTVANYAYSMYLSFGMVSDIMNMM